MYSGKYEPRILRFWDEQDYQFGDHQNKEHTILGSRLGSPCLGKLPFVVASWLLARRLKSSYP